MTTLKLGSESSALGTAIGRIPSGCSILTVSHAGRSTGILLSWIQQAAFEPPLVTVGMKNGRFAYDWVEASGRFLLNIVGNEPAAMFKHFGRGFGPEEDAFAGLEIVATDFGPQISACVAHLGCKVVNRMVCGDHTLVIGQVAMAASKDGATPYVHLRKNGLSY